MLRLLLSARIAYALRLLLQAYRQLQQGVALRNRLTCSIQQCCFDIVAGVDRAQVVANCYVPLALYLACWFM